MIARLELTAKKLVLAEKQHTCFICNQPELLLTLLQTKEYMCNNPNCPRGTL